MKNFIVMFKKEIRELWKTKKVITFLSVALAVALISPMIAYNMPDLINQMNIGTKIKLPEPTVVDAYLHFFKNMSSLVLLAMIVLFSTSIPDEKNKGTLKMVLTNQVSIKNVVFAKITAQIVVATLVYLVSIASFLLYTVLLFKTVQVPHPVLSFVSFYGYVLFTIVIINCIGTLSQKGTTAIILSIIVFLILAMTSMIPQVGQYVPNYLLTASSHLVNGMKNLTSWYWSLGITGILTVIIAIVSTQTKKFY